jgi:perosamine synthetase
MADGAHAALTRLNGAGTGGRVEATAESIHLNKTLTCGEGGALALNDDALFERGRILRSHGMDYFRRGVLHEVGFNFRLTNLACGILCAQLGRVPSIRRRRALIKTIYDDIFTTAARSGDCDVQLQPLGPGVEQEVWLYSVLVPNPALLANRLSAAGIETRPLFQPVHRLPFYREAASRSPAPLPVTDRLAATGISLPTYNSLNPTCAERIAKIATSALRGLPMSDALTMVGGGDGEELEQQKN